MSTTSQDQLIGTLVDDRYRVAERLARGGMSTVYRALDTRLERDVAMKVLYPHLAEDPSLVDKFEREAKTAAALNHPHVVNVYDQGIQSGPDGRLAYLVMEYVPGVTLRSVLGKHRALTPHLTLVYLLALVDGLAAAHRAGLVHRDMKPENVLVSREGDIKVADFGLARAATNHTGTGAALMGTVAYVSPELASGGRADMRSDVYAVGIMMFEMLTGRQPFTGQSAVQIAFKHVNSRVPAPSTLAPGLAESLDDVVLWCTHPDPDQRPSDAQELLDQLVVIRERLTDAQLDYTLPLVPTEMPLESSADGATTALPDASAPTTDELDDAPPPKTTVYEESLESTPAPAVEPVGSDRDPATAIYGQAPQAVDSASSPAPAATPPRQLKGAAARRAARTPTERLSAARPGRVAIIVLVVVMLAALAQLLGWWIGTSGF
ncbi:MAG: protein kinase domain-containing protein [Micrococcaceae bacterium]